MVQGVGGTGSSGSIKNTIAYQTFYEMYLKSGEKNLDFESWLKLTGKMGRFLERVENYVETGDEENGDDTKDTLNGNRHLSNSTGALYQSVDDETFYEFDWDSGSYNAIQGKDAAAKALGLPDGEDVDTISLGYMTAKITNYTFGNLDDGQDGTKQTVYNKYANVSYVQQEFDIHYIMNALLIDPSDPQYQIAKGIFDDLCLHVNQWLPVADQEELDKVAAEYGNNSAEYKAKLQEVMLANLDQANEWVEEHNHVANTNAGSLGEATDLYPDATTGEAGVNGSTSSGDTSQESTDDVDYDMNNVLTAAGMSTAYARGEERKVESTDNSEGNRRKELQAMMDEDLVAIANALSSQLGDQLTDEIQTYINKAISTTAGKTELIDTWSEKHGFLSMHKKTLGKYNIKEVADTFFAEFDTLCKNKGKTTEEVAAEEKAAEEKAAKEKNDYKTLYNYDMASIAKDAGVKDTQVINVSTAAEIKQKAMNEVVQPLINKLKSKMSGKSISDADLEKILNYAAEKALANTTEWASTSNNYVYNIDADIVVDKFETAVKEAIKAKGYDF